MANIDHSHDRVENLTHSLLDFFRWSFMAPQLDKRVARSAMLILSGVSLLMAVAVMIIALV